MIPGLYWVMKLISIVRLFVVLVILLFQTPLHLTIFLEKAKIKQLFLLFQKIIVCEIKRFLLLLIVINQFRRLKSRMHAKIHRSGRCGY